MPGETLKGVGSATGFFFIITEKFANREKTITPEILKQNPYPVAFFQQTPPLFTENRPEADVTHATPA